MDKIFVLGSNGFVGKNLLNKLKKENKKVYGYNRECIDLLDIVKVLEIMSYKPDYVFICSAVVGGIQANIKNPYKFLYENLVIQNNVINACIKYKIKTVVFLGSSCIYPKDYIQPLKEEYLLKAPIEKTNEGYALAKIAGLKLCEYANKQFDTNFISLMPCNLYGEYDNFDLKTSHVLSALINKIYNAKQNNIDVVEILGSGNAKREFLYISDFIDCLLWSMNVQLETDTFLNVGTGWDISIKKLAYLIGDIIGYTGDYYFNTDMHDGMNRKCLDVTKINNLGWKYTIPLKEGIEKTVEWYKDKLQTDRHHNVYII